MLRFPDYPHGQMDFSKFQRTSKVITVETGVQRYDKSGNPEQYVEPYEYISNWEYAEHGIAEREKKPHAVVCCVAMKPRPERILRIRRSEREKIYPNYSSIPIGHMYVYSSDGNEVHLPGYFQAMRKLGGETGLLVISPQIVKPILKNHILEDKSLLHIGFAYLLLVPERFRPRYDEINPMASDFIGVEDLEKELAAESFTPLSRSVLELFLEKYRSGVDELFGSNQNSF